MTIRDLLKETEHRPYVLPLGKWKYYQEWNKAVFLHWKVAIDELRTCVPGNLEIDLFEGEAWVSVVAFTMNKIRPRILPAFSPVSDFDEINIRTYVRRNNKQGVYFLSIEGGKLLSCKIARGLSGLPYRYSGMKREKGKYVSTNESFGDVLKLSFITGETLLQKDSLDKWLTERYALFQDVGQDIREFDIHHIEWPLKKIDVEELTLSCPRFSALVKGQPDKIHYSPGVQVVAW